MIVSSVCSCGATLSFHVPENPELRKGITEAFRSEVKRHRSECVRGVGEIVVTQNGVRVEIEAAGL